MNIWIASVFQIVISVLDYYNCNWIIITRIGSLSLRSDNYYYGRIIVTIVG